MDWPRKRRAWCLARPPGLDPALLSAVMNASSARCWSCEQYNPAPVRRARGCRSVVVASCAGVPG